MMHTFKHCNDKKRRVFMIDDNDAVLSSMAMLLSKQNIQLTSFSSFTQLIDGIQQGAPDCLLIEYNLQPDNGLVIYNALLKNQILLPTIFLATYSDINTAVNAMRAGASDFIEKPFTETRLMRSLQRALDKDQFKTE